ncbi:class I SAM-dependent methyltransferase [Mycolicibacterium psychrotolerans]|nr:class I SAM-dependent methyltransferase [Mycolicibacterium psychrotolerans]
MDVGDLEPVERTALLTEYARALDASAARPILADPLARSTVDEIDFPFSDLGVTPSVRTLVALRARMLDQRVRDFVTVNPCAVVVDLGAGLNSMVFRVDPPATVDWFSVDLPRVIQLRNALLPQRENARNLSASVIEDDWAATLPRDRSTAIVADGLFAFLTESAIVGLFRGLTTNFPSGMLVFNDYGRVGRLNRITGRLAMRGTNSPHQHWNFAGFKDARHPETWNPRLHLNEEVSAMFEPEAAAFPMGLRLASRVAKRFPPIARKARVLRYRF